MRWIFCVAVLTMGCRASLGECNDLELSIVFRDDATLGAIPMYDGQALMIQSCGAQNGNCHSSGAQGMLREGVPLGFDFNVDPFSQTACGEDTNTPACLAEQARLRTAVQIAFDYRELSWNEVAEGRMPPGGAKPPMEDDPKYYRTLSPETGYEDELPGLHTEEGRRLFRNWVACGMPVVGHIVESTSTTEPGDNCDAENEEDRPYGQCRVGGEPPAPPQPTWGGDDGIHQYLLNSGCAIAQCHGGDTYPTISDDPMLAYDALVGQPSSDADTHSCADRILIASEGDDPVASSLLYEKLSASPTCLPPAVMKCPPVETPAGRILGADSCVDRSRRKPLTAAAVGESGAGVFKPRTLLDAATGSRLLECGIDPARAAMDGAEQLLALHRADMEAGAEWLTAATFSSTDPIAVREAVVLACSLGLPVMASLGPFGSAADIRARAELCLEHGAQLIALETFVDDERLCEVVRALRGLPTLASYCPLAGAKHTPARFLEAGASALGVNCGDALSGLVDAAIALVPLGADIVMRPSAGVPSQLGEHPVGAAQFGEALRRGWRAGVHAAGGCCGVTPAHLRAALAPKTTT